MKRIKTLVVKNDFLFYYTTKTLSYREEERDQRERLNWSENTHN